MEEKIKKILERILYFLKKSYPKLIIGIFVLVFLISSYIIYLETKNEILNLEEAISFTEKSLKENDKKIEPHLEEFRTLNCNESFISDFKISSYQELFNKFWGEYGKEKFLKCKTLGGEISRNFNTHNFVLNQHLKYEKELEKKKQTSFLLLWAQKFLQSTLFIILILTILSLPILRVLFLLVFHIKRQITKMATFQKYLIGLVFGVLIVLILILFRIYF